MLHKMFTKKAVDPLTLISAYDPFYKKSVFFYCNFIGTVFKLSCSPELVFDVQQANRLFMFT